MSDCKDGLIPVVIHRKNHKKWKVTMTLDDFMKFYTTYFNVESVGGENENS